MSFAPGSIARLREIRGEPSDPYRIAYVFVLVRPEPPFIAAYPEIRVAPISFAVAHATDVDVICAAGAGGLDRPFLVEMWAQGPMLVEELEPVAVSQVSPTTLAHAYAVHNAMVDADAPVPADVVGPPIEAAGGPRIAYQELRAEMTDSLSRRAMALLAERLRACERREAEATGQWSGELTAVSSRRSEPLPARAAL